MAPFQSVLPISAIEIKLLAPHLAHAVSNGPYSAVDIGDSGAAVVSVDGRFSHTHGVGLFLTKWIWKEGANILATEATTSFTLPVGVHDVALTVVDSGNNAHTDMTTITVLSSGYPDITGISPSSGSIVGSDQITITGSGFTYPAKQTIVHFGNVDLSGNAIQVINATTIQVLSPAFTVGAPVEVSVKTPRGTSTAVPFTYVAASPIAFLSAKLTDFESPTAAVFGPDGKLYVGSLYGKLAKLTLNDDFTAVTSQVISMVANYRAILEIAFDPMDAGADNPPVYCTSSYFFHRDSNSSSGNSINGKVHKVSGGNLDNVVDVITGLPVADHDHGKPSHDPTWYSTSTSGDISYFLLTQVSMVSCSVTLGSYTSK